MLKSYNEKLDGGLLRKKKIMNEKIKKQKRKLTSLNK